MDEVLMSLLILGCIIIAIVTPIIIDHNTNVIASNIANILCKNKGFETYVTYSRKIFGSKPYNIVCGTLRERLIAEGKIVAYDTNNNTPLIVGNPKRIE